MTIHRHQAYLWKFVFTNLFTDLRDIMCPNMPEYANEHIFVMQRKEAESLEK